MKPVDYVDRINASYQSMGYPPYQWSENQEAPLTRLKKPLSECTVSMLTSGGISYANAEPFEPAAKNNFRLDEIDPQSGGDSFQINDAYYDYRDGEKDINVIFPIERLRELAGDGVIGAVARRLWSGFMGRTYKRRQVIEVEAPRFADALQQDGVDAIVMVPA